MIRCIFCEADFKDIDQLKVHSGECQSHPLFRELSQTKEKIGKLTLQLARAEDQWRYYEVLSVELSYENRDLREEIADLKSQIKEIENEQRSKQ